MKHPALRDKNGRFIETTVTVLRPGRRGSKARGISLTRPTRQVNRHKSNRNAYLSGMPKSL